MSATEFGDFQTPLPLARAVVARVAEFLPEPATVVEPTCGRGSLLFAALDHFPRARGLGVEINPGYVEECRAMLPEGREVEVVVGDFFTTDWPAIIDRLPPPLLLVGNPPWVTNAALGVLASDNLPRKENRQSLPGIEAITGRSNFDISEWMIDRLMMAMAQRDGAVAMLCKTAVARKLLHRAWSEGRGPAEADLYLVDSEEHFGASVAAGLLRCRFRPGLAAKSCRIWSGLDADSPNSGEIGLGDGELVSDLAGYQRLRHLRSRVRQPWRSGVKHDCARVMELTREAGGFRNQLGELVELEEEYLYPLLKSSDLAHRRAPSRWLLVTQRAPGEATAQIAERAPATWRYLTNHGELLDRRASSIYRSRPRFAIFGVGDYSFAPYKVAISGLYKQLQFSVVGQQGGKPILLDDTAYFLPCGDLEEAERLARALNSEPAQGFYRSLLFWDNKRPITARLLGRLDLALL